MAQLIVRNLEEDVKRRLRIRANRHGRSMEEEVREVLRNAVRGEEPSTGGLGSRLRARFAKRGLDAEIPEIRGTRARPARIAE